MRRTGQFNRAIGPNGIQIHFENGTFQLGLTGKIPADIPYEDLCISCRVMLEELLTDIKPHLEEVISTDAEDIIRQAYAKINL